ncbi:MAG: FAD-dependent oxidoreductase, partial [Xanthobacteraceae bacterium]
AQEFGYPAEGGAEFVHGPAPVTRALMREAGLSLVPIEGTRWGARNGAFSPNESQLAHAALLHRALSEVKSDLPVAEFLKTHFTNPQYAELRDAVKRMVEGYDAADPDRASTFALRDEWTGRGLSRQARIAGGYGALIKFLVSECRGQGTTIHLFSVVTAIEESRGRIAAYCNDGTIYEADAAILAVPLPILRDISLPHGVHEKVAASTDIGFGNVVKILLRFSTKWWTNCGGRDLSDLSFLFSSATVPVWWTQHPAEFPVLTGWFAGPKADAVAQLTVSELVTMGLDSSRRFSICLRTALREISSPRKRSTGASMLSHAALIPMPLPKHGKHRRRCENRMLALYSFLAKRCMPAGIWAQSKQR